MEPDLRYAFLGVGEHVHQEEERDQSEAYELPPPADWPGLRLRCCRTAVGLPRLVSGTPTPPAPPRRLGHGVELDPEGRHRLGDVLDLLWSGELVADDQLAADLVVHGAGDDDTARHR